MLTKPFNIKLRSPFGSATHLQPVPDHRLTGTIKKYLSDRGFGFISVKGLTDDITDSYFFHFSHFAKVDQPRIVEGAVVEFTPVNGREGPCAEQLILKSDGVVPIKTDSALPALSPEAFAEDAEFIELRVKSITSAKALAGSIVAHIMRGESVVLSAIGHGAVAQAVKAVPIASGRTAPNGFMLAIVPSFNLKEIDPPKDAPPLPEGEVMERTLTMMHLVKIRPR